MLNSCSPACLTACDCCRCRCLAVCLNDCLTANQPARQSACSTPSARLLKNCVCLCVPGCYSLLVGRQSNRQTTSHTYWAHTFSVELKRPAHGLLVHKHKVKPLAIPSNAQMDSLANGTKHKTFSVIYVSYSDRMLLNGWMNVRAKDAEQGFGWLVYDFLRAPWNRGNFSKQKDT